MDVQAAQWNAQLNRMVSLCMQEAAEYERGRTLQVLQPSLASLLQPKQRSVVVAVNSQNAGHQSASGRAQSGTPSKHHEQQHASGSSSSEAAVAGGSCLRAAASIKQEECAAGDPQQTSVAHTPAAVGAAAATAALTTPMATLAGAPGAGLLPMQAPLGIKQRDGVLVSMPAESAARAAVMLSSGLSSQQMLVCNSMLQLPLQQPKLSDVTPAAVAAAAAAHTTPQHFQLAYSGIDTATTPALVLPTFSNQLMQHMLMQQAQQQQFMQQQQQQQQQQQAHGSPGVFAPVITTTQPNARKGKRRGYSIQPEALKALVARQMQGKQPPKLEEQQSTQQDPKQQHDQQQVQPPTGLQQQQLGARSQPQQQHRQRSMPRIPPMLRQLPAGSFDAAVEGGLAAAPDESPGSAVAGLLPLQLPMGLESPGAACLGLKMTCGEELEQPGVQLDLHPTKLFGSAQKRLRLSMCDEPHLHAARGSGGGYQQDQLSAALISPVAVPAAAAVARDAAAAARLPTAVLPPGAAAGEHHTSLELQQSGLVTPSKFFAGSPVAVVGGAGTTGRATVAGADVPQPVFATPSKFFSGSPVADDASFKCSGLQDTEPETPLLFGHGAASPWPPRQLAMDVQPPTVVGAAAAAAAAAGGSSNVLRSSTNGAGMAASNRQAASGAASAAQPMSWVPVGGHTSQPVGLLAAGHDAAGSAATPAGAGMKLGLLCTPMAAGQGDGKEGAPDAAAAAAAPVDRLPMKAATAAAAGAGAALPAEAGAAAAAIPVGVSLTTPAGHEQQALATPVTGVQSAG